MKRSGIYIIIIIVLAIVGIVLFASKRYSTLENADSFFTVQDTASITKIFIADKNEHQVLLSRKGKGWVLDRKFPANQDNIEILLETLKRMKVKAPVSLSRHNNVVRRMATTGIKVEIYQMVYRIDLFDKIKLFKHEKQTKVFYVGGPTQNNLGTDMLMEGAERPYVVFIPSFRGFLSTRFSPLADDWKSHIVFHNKLADIVSVSLDFGKDPGNSFRVNVEDKMGHYKLIQSVTGKQFMRYDTLKLLNFLTSFTDLRYETRLNNLRTKEEIDSITHLPEIYQLTLIDRQQDTTVVKMFEKKEIDPKEVEGDVELIPIDHDRFYALINGGEDFVLMQYFVFDNVLKPLSYYTGEPN